MAKFNECFERFENTVLSSAVYACAILGDIAVIYTICRLIKEHIGFWWILFLLIITLPFLIPFNKQLLRKIKERMKKNKKDENMF